MNPRLRVLAAPVALIAGLSAMAPAYAQNPEPQSAVEAPAPEADAPEAAIVVPGAEPEAATAAPEAPAATTPESKPDEAVQPLAAATRVPAPPSGKGQVVFFRASKLAGMALSFSVREGDKGVAKVGNGAYAIVVADPGPHAYTMESEAKDTLNVEVEEGETIYVEHTIGMGIMMGRPHLTPSTQADFDRRANLKLSTSKPTDKTSSAAK